MKNSRFFLGFLLCACVLLSVAAVRRNFYADNNTYITTGTSVSSTDGTVTNTFASAFSSAPKVLLSCTGTLVSSTNLITSITTTNFVVNNRSASITNTWIAIGVP